MILPFAFQRCRPLRTRDATASPGRRLARARGVLGLLVVLLTALPPAVSGQQELPAVPVDSLALGGPGVSPGGAFLRAVLLPGWGHASIGAYNRGAFYFAAQAGTAYGLMRTRLRLREARERRTLQEEVRTRRLRDQGVTDPEEIEAALEEDAGYQEIVGLVGAREQQQEDWAALGIFLLLLGGADAFVSAHLQDFPDPLDLQIRATDAGAAELSVRVPVP